MFLKLLILNNPPILINFESLISSNNNVESVLFMNEIEPSLLQSRYLLKV